MTDLASLVGVTRQAISAFENSIDIPSHETIAKLSNILGLPVSFFSIQRDNEKISGPIFFRSNKTAKKKDRETEKVKADWIMRSIYVLSKNLELPKVNIPDFGITDFESLSEEDIEDIADKTRSFFNLGFGPISNITRLLENNGIPVVLLNTSAKIGAFSFTADSGAKFIISEKNATGVRNRFSLAHELGHLILHQSLDSNFLEDKDLFDLVEKQADLFASAFLLPSITFAAEFYSPKLQSLIGLKQRWKVSIAAIAMRSHQLKIINDNQRGYIFKQLAPYRKKEPLDNIISNESPSFLKTVLEVSESNNLITKPQLRDLLALPASELSQFFDAPEEDFFDASHEKVIPIGIKR